MSDSCTDNSALGAGSFQGKAGCGVTWSWLTEPVEMPVLLAIKSPRDRFNTVCPVPHRRCGTSCLPLGTVVKSTRGAVRALISSIDGSIEEYTGYLKVETLEGGAWD